jgi:GntR family transcriptional regulator
MIISVDLSEPTPAYLQIVEAVRRAIALGSLRAGDRLPPIRETAVNTRVNRNTVGRAYLELQHQRLVVARQGSGFYVMDNGADVERTVRQEALAERARELVLEARLAGTSTDQLVRLLRETASSLESQETRGPQQEKTDE